jgi:hypothetical protein
MTAEKPETPAAGELPSIDFSTLVLSLATSAMMHMGLVPDPGTGESPDKNLALAHQTIDTLEMLQLKTRGNLEEEETRLLQSVLYELRMSYVKARG